MKKKKLLNEIILLQTIGPILVILGHSINGLPHNNILNFLFKDFIYVFHMPLFFFIAGFTFYYTNLDKEIDYAKFVKKKAIRLLIPYVFLNVIFIIPKCLLNSYLTDEISISLTYIIKIFLSPRDNILGHTWFLVALFIVYCFAPQILKIYKKNKLTFFLISFIFLILSIFPYNTNFLTIGDLCKNVIFFIIGIIICSKKTIFSSKKTSILLILSISFTFTLWLNFEHRFFELIFGCSILLLLLSVGLLLSNKINENIISQNSMTIYLFHWPFMLFIRILLHQILHINYYIVVMSMILAGIFLPLTLKKIIYKLNLNKRIKFIDILIGG